MLNLRETKRKNVEIKSSADNTLKQNYTMLDNLKLGYGGTKTEMERLVKDASQMLGVQKELNVTVKDGDLSFANIANAISVVQKNLGIAGTTSKEAAGTITGSVASMRSAWQNLLVEFAKGQATITAADLAKPIEEAGIAWEKYNDAYWMTSGGGMDGLTDEILYNLQTQKNSVEETAEYIAYEYDMSMQDAMKAVTAAESAISNFSPESQGKIDEYLDYFVKSVETAASNIIPRLQIIVDGIGKMIEQVSPLLAEKLPDLIASVLPALISSGTKTIKALAMSLPKLLKVIAPPLLKGLREVLSAISEVMPDTIAAVEGITHEVVSALTAAMPLIIQIGGTILSSLVSSIISNLPQLLKSAKSIISTIATGLTQNLQMLIPKAIEIITELLLALTDPSNLETLITGAIGLITALAKGLIVALPILIEKAPVILGNLMTALVGAAPEAFVAAVDIIATLGDTLLSNIGVIFTAGQKIIQSLISGIKGFLGHLWDTIAGIGVELWNNVKGWISDAWTWGKDLISNFLNGAKEMFLDSRWSKFWEGVGESIADFLHHSTPEKGALKDDDKWGGDFMDNIISGVAGEIPELTSTVSNVADAMSGAFSPEKIDSLFIIDIEKTLAAIEEAKEMLSGAFEPLSGAYTVDASVKASQIPITTAPYTAPVTAKSGAYESTDVTSYDGAVFNINIQSGVVNDVQAARMLAEQISIEIQRQENESKHKVGAWVL